MIISTAAKEVELASLLMCSTTEGYEARITDVADAVAQTLTRVLKERLETDSSEEYEDAQEVIKAIRRACKSQKRKGKQQNPESP